MTLYRYEFKTEENVINGRYSVLLTAPHTPNIFDLPNDEVRF